MLDGDKDGLISEAEFRCVCCCAPFSVLDSDGDGMLSRKEYEGGFDVFDMDGDGFASKAELNQPLYKLVAKWNGTKFELTIGHLATVGQVRVLLERKRMCREYFIVLGWREPGFGFSAPPASYFQL
jgi:hypothetical protein